MSLVAYRPQGFKPDSLVKIDRANQIIAENAAAGFSLTLRQLFYQFVSRGWLDNTHREYKNLGTLITNGRMAGKISWNAIEDRTRALESLNHWDDPRQIIRAVANQYREDAWFTQTKRVEVWVEKDALKNVVEQACNPLRVPFFSCRGYTSQSEMWVAGQRIIGRWRFQNGQAMDPRLRQSTVILHLGDHDPSGLHMTKDIRNRLAGFCEFHGVPGPAVKRIALNLDQVRQYDPPPNPGKDADPRWKEYEEEFGDQSWELDALQPNILVALIRQEIEGFLDPEPYDKALAEEAKSKAGLRLVSQNWDAVIGDATDRWGESAEEEEEEEDGEPDE